MSVFERVEMTWRGQSYVIPPNRALKAIAKIEEVLTLQQLQDRTRVPLAKIAMAYGTVLRFAGAPATDEEVYEVLFGDGAVEALVVINVLVGMMVPKRVRERIEAKVKADAEAPAEGKEEAVTTAAS